VAPFRHLSRIFPPPSSKAESFRRSRIADALGVLRSCVGLVRSGRVFERPSQNSLVETALPAACSRSHSSAGTANRERRGITPIFRTATPRRWHAKGRSHALRAFYPLANQDG
jgi:hypothetical protein